LLYYNHRKGKQKKGKVKKMKKNEKMMKVTYTNRNNKTRTEVMNLDKYCQLVQSLVWTKGRIDEVEHL